MAHGTWRMTKHMAKGYHALVMARMFSTPVRMWHVGRMWNVVLTNRQQTSAMNAQNHHKRNRGFRSATDLVARRVRAVAQKRGFSESRLLTHWAEIVGHEIATMAWPVSVKYGYGHFGATLTLLTSGACAPVVALHEARIRESVNACYGYTAIGRVRVTQTSPHGFAEGAQAVFRGAPATAPAPSRGAPPASRGAPAAPNGAAQPDRTRTPTPSGPNQADIDVGDVRDPRLRAALERFGASVFATRHRQRGVIASGDAHKRIAT